MRLAFGRSRACSSGPPGSAPGGGKGWASAATPPTTSVSRLSSTSGKSRRRNVMREPPSSKIAGCSSSGGFRALVLRAAGSWSCQIDAEGPEVEHGLGSDRQYAEQDADPLPLARRRGDVDADDLLDAALLLQRFDHEQLGEIAGRFGVGLTHELRQPRAVVGVTEGGELAFRSEQADLDGLAQVVAAARTGHVPQAHDAPARADAALLVLDLINGQGVGAHEAQRDVLEQLWKRHIILRSSRSRQRPLAPPADPRGRCT